MKTRKICKCPKVIQEGYVEREMMQRARFDVKRTGKSRFYHTLKSSRWEFVYRKLTSSHKGSSVFAEVLG